TTRATCACCAACTTASRRAARGCSAAPERLLEERRPPPGIARLRVVESVVKPARLLPGDGHADHQGRHVGDVAQLDGVGRGEELPVVLRDLAVENLHARE